jgi:hypothetical protein
MMKPFLVSYYLYCYKLIGLVVIAFKGLTKAALAEEFNDFISVAHMIFEHYLIISSIIVESVVVRDHW